MNILLNIIIFLLIVVLIVFLVIKYRYEKAQQFTLMNSLGCGVQKCPIVPQTNLIYDINPMEYCANAVAQFIKTNENAMDDMTVLSKIKLNNKEDDIGLIAISKIALFIIFRGSQTIYDVVTDLELSQQKYNINPNNTNPMVHSGFFKSFQDIQPMLNFQNNSIKNVIIAGHSLGGALAILSGNYIANLNPQINVKVFTFASPAVGNHDFTSIKFPNLSIYRMVNLCDVVPTLPASVSPNFMNPEEPWLYEQDPSTLTTVFSNNKKSVFNNHNIENYLEYFKSIN